MLAKKLVLLTLIIVRAWIAEATHYITRILI